MKNTRHSFTLMLMAFVKARPNVWIRATEFEQFGRQAWRTRLSEARDRFKVANDGTIENRVRMVVPGQRYPVISEYRYVPKTNDETRVDGHGWLDGTGSTASCVRMTRGIVEKNAISPMKTLAFGREERKIAGESESVETGPDSPSPD